MRKADYILDKCNKYYRFISLANTPTVNLPHVNMPGGAFHGPNINTGTHISTPPAAHINEPHINEPSFNFEPHINEPSFNFKPHVGKGQITPSKIGPNGEISLKLGKDGRPDPRSVPDEFCHVVDGVRQIKPEFLPKIKDAFKAHKSGVIAQAKYDKQFNQVFEGFGTKLMRYYSNYKSIPYKGTITIALCSIAWITWKIITKSDPNAKNKELANTVSHGANNMPLSGTDNIAKNTEVSKSLIDIADLLYKEIPNLKKEKNQQLFTKVSSDATDLSSDFAIKQLTVDDPSSASAFGTSLTNIKTKGVELREELTKVNPYFTSNNREEDAKKITDVISQLDAYVALINSSSKANKEIKSNNATANTVKNPILEQDL